MNTQNILGYNGQKLEIKYDFSELFDFTLDSSDNIDLKLDFSDILDFELVQTEIIDLRLDYSDYIDFELDNSDITPIIYINPIIDESLDYCDHVIQTQDYFSILTQNDECILYQE